MFELGRRDFITLLGGAAAAWPIAGRAQQPAPKLRRIGVLMSQTADDPDALSRIAAFAQGLQELGWTVGGNMAAGGKGRAGWEGLPDWFSGQ
jgi:putative ABC transport system substrate-binding protein